MDKKVDEQPSPPREPRGVRWKQLLERSRVGLVFTFGVLAALIGLLVYNGFFPGPHVLTASEVSDIAAQTLASATPGPALSEQVYREIQPSIVLIQTQIASSNGDGASGLGSGVVIDDQGDILTSLHVVYDATSIKVTFADGTQSSAQITTRQPENDIAVLRADQQPAQIAPATLGNPNALQVGDEAYVVGNPFGLYSSMSAGIISGFDRSFHPVGSTTTLKGLIQIDAAVNPGNSGGPLLNRYGQVVGIVTGILNPTDQDVFIGIGFAVPIDVAAGAMGSPPD
jgi:S1-C subfamily serine protease